MGELNVLDLFSGIGGFSLGLERAGMRTVAFCENEPYARAVLQKHWPNVPCYDDVRTLTVDRLRTDGIVPDVICGGFPCQDISIAGAGAGIEGERSGLWQEYRRIIGEFRPLYVIVENVAALLGRGLDRVLGDLAALGYDAEWHCIPASAVGAPHRRDRIWIMAYPSTGLHAGGLDRRGARHKAGRGKGGNSGEGRSPYRERLWLELGASRAAMADTNEERLAVGIESALGTPSGHAQSQRQGGVGGKWWAAEPAVGRVAHGVSRRVDRIGVLGNAVVPQIPEIIGRAIIAHAEAIKESAA